MRVRPPTMEPEFNIDKSRPITWCVTCINGESCICNDAADALDLLKSECKAYLQIMAELYAKRYPKETA